MIAEQSDFPLDVLSPDMSDVVSHISEEEDQRRERDSEIGTPVPFVPLVPSPEADTAMAAQLEGVAKHAERLHITPQTSQSEVKSPTATPGERAISFS
jgi:hypothetical protein